MTTIDAGSHFHLPEDDRYGECPQCPDPIVHLRAQARPDLFRVYVWEAPVRLAHWVIVLSMLVLVPTGIYIGNPFIEVSGQARDVFVMGTVKAIHLYAAIAFAAAVIMRLIWMLTGNQAARWDKFIPWPRRRRQGLIPTLRFYLFALRKPPGFVGHNPLAGLTYAVVFLLYVTMIMTGMAMWSASRPTSWAGHFTWLIPLVGGLQAAHWIHHIAMWLLVGFVAHHIYSAAMMSVIEQNATMESMFSGYKFVPREDLLYSGYRFVRRHYEKIDGEVVVADSGHDHPHVRASAETSGGDPPS